MAIAIVLINLSALYFKSEIPLLDMRIKLQRPIFIYVLM